MKLSNYPFLIAVLILLASCAAPKATVTLPEKQQQSTKDSLIYIIKDSIHEKWKHDTLFITRYKNQYIYRNIGDTLYKEVPVQVEVPVEVTPKWAYHCLIACIVLFAALGIKIVLRMAKFIYGRKI